MIVIDATNLIAGRISTFATKKALLGDKIVIVNSEKAVLSGNKYTLFKAYKRRYSMGVPSKGPFMPRMADRFLRRIIRGMLPYKQPRGVAAFKNIMCYIGVPEEFKSSETISIEGANISKLPNLKYLTIGEICKNLGGRQ